MQNRFSEQASRAYRQNGFAIVPAILSEEQTSAAIATIEAIQSGVDDLPPQLTGKLAMERDLPARKRGGIASEETGNAIFIIGDLPAFDSNLAALLIDHSLIKMVRSLLGTEDIRYHFSNVTMKRQRIGSGISWHRDFPNKGVCPATSSFLRLMLCLDGMDAENGATQFVAGSHLISDADAPAAVSAREAADSGTVIATAVCPPGSAVIIHPKSVHGGPPNTSARHRRNVIVQWGRADDPIEVTPGTEETWMGFSVPEIEEWISRRNVKAQ